MMDSPFKYMYPTMFDFPVLNRCFKTQKDKCEQEHKFQNPTDIVNP